MTIYELKKAIDNAIENGINMDCAVVLDLQSVPPHACDWPVLEKVIDPSSDCDFLWFTLVFGEDANERDTIGHYGENF